jgi:hypothetical protein
MTDESGKFRVDATIPEWYSIFAPQRFDITALGNRSVRFASTSFRLDS